MDSSILFRAKLQQIGGKNETFPTFQGGNAANEGKMTMNTVDW
jgi:hypothetical protein